MCIFALIYEEFIKLFFFTFLTKCLWICIVVLCIYAVLSFVQYGMEWHMKQVTETKFPQGDDKVTTTTTICKNRLLIFFKSVFYVVMFLLCFIVLVSCILSYYLT